MNKVEELINMSKLNELLNKKEEEEKKCSKVVWVFAIIGVVAAIAGIALNIILPGNDYEFGVNEAGYENRGIHTNSKRKEEK